MMHLMIDGFIKILDILPTADCELYYGANKMKIISKTNSGYDKHMNQQQCRTLRDLNTHDVFRSIFQHIVGGYEERNHYVSWMRTEFDSSKIQLQDGRLLYEHGDYIIRLYSKDDMKMFTVYLGQKCLYQGTY